MNNKKEKPSKEKSVKPEKTVKPEKSSLKNQIQKNFTSEMEGVKPDVIKPANQQEESLINNLESLNTDNNQKAILDNMTNNIKQVSELKKNVIRAFISVFVFPIPWIVAITLIIIKFAANVDLPIYALIIPWVFPLLPILGFICYAVYKLKQVQKKLSTLGFSQEKHLEQSIQAEEERRAQASTLQNQQEGTDLDSNIELISKLKSAKSSIKNLQNQKQDADKSNDNLELNNDANTHQQNIINNDSSSATKPKSNVETNSKRSNVETNSKKTNVETNSKKANVETNSKKANVEINSTNQNSNKTSVNSQAKAASGIYQLHDAEELKVILEENLDNKEDFES